MLEEITTTPQKSFLIAILKNSEQNNMKKHNKQASNTLTLLSPVIICQGPKYVNLSTRMLIR